MKIYDTIIVGGGLSGLSSAYFLSKNDFNVLVIEKEKELGGLCGSYRINGYYIEHFYHHVFHSDNTLKEILKELKIENLLEWKDASTGFYIDEKIYKLDTIFDMLTFPLNLFDKIKLGLIILKIKISGDFSDLDKIPAKDWLIKNGGNKLYKNFFLPLLKGKYGDMMDESSTAWLFDRIKLRSSRSLKGEKLGYMKYGFNTLIEKLKEKITEHNGKIITDSDVVGIMNEDSNKLSVLYSSKKCETKNVISSIPPQKLLKICNLPKNYATKLQRIKYQGTICLLLGLKKPLQETYWLNIESEKLPFAAIIEHTNFHNIPEYKDRLVYVTSYIQSENDPIWNISDEGIVKSFIGCLKKMFPNFTETDINWWKVQKNKYSVPIYNVGYIENMPSFETPIKGLYLTGMLLTPFERSIDRSLKIGKECAMAIINSLGG